jgi:diacylglycerol kinase
MKNTRISVFSRLKSFMYAFEGVKVLLREEHNSRIHLLAALVAVAAGIYFNINSYEWMAVVFSIGLVFTAEIFNTVIENLCDFVSPGQNEKIKRIKDLSAAAVLVSAVTAFCIGLIVFLPKFHN